MILFWAILTAPLLLTSTLSDIFNILGSVQAPVRIYRASLDSAFSAVGVNNRWPQWVTDIGILCSLLGFILWVYVVRIRGEAARQLKAAEEGRAFLIQPQPISVDVVDATLGTTLAGGMLVSGAVGHSMLASGAALAGTGPIGWVIAPFALAMGALWAMTERDKRRKALAEFHAEQETLRLAREQLAIALINVKDFKHRETRKLTIASSIVAVLVITNFMIEFVFGYK